MLSLAESKTLTIANTAVITDDIPPPGPRRNDPLRDSVYFYLGVAPPNLFWPADTMHLPQDKVYFIGRRKQSYDARLEAYGFQRVARSAKLVLFKVR